MIRRLRIKFVCINMVLVTAMLWAILAVVLHSTQAGLASESIRAMEAAALPGPQRPAGPGWGPRCFTLEPGPDGDLIASPGADSFGGEAWLGQVWEAARGRQEGLLEEVRALRDAGVPRDSTALQAIGYKELLPALEGACSLEEAAAEIKLRSRQYAKRQLTWLRRNLDIHWIYWEKKRDFAAALQNATEILMAQGLQ